MGWYQRTRLVLSLVFLVVGGLVAGGTVLAGPVRHTELYWGDTHLHTSYSPDAYFLQNRSADPETAYRYAKGLPVVHPYHRAKIRIETPLDFLVVADHAEMMGVPLKLFEGDPELTKTESGQRFMKLIEQDKGEAVFQEFITAINTNQPIEDLDSERVRRSVWHESLVITERHNDPGTFTAFAGWEWTSTPGGANLHRVVFMREGRSVAKQFLPFSSLDSGKPEDLWQWLESTAQKTGAHFVAIPHNSNISMGRMFPADDSEGRPLTAAYARTRMRWEPVVEVTQIKGDSETHPTLSRNDEFADFETFAHLLEATGTAKAKAEAKIQPGDYVRSALKRGLEVEGQVGVNPYKFGLVGSTDAHTAMASAEEDNFWGKVALDSIPENKTETISLGIAGWDMSASGLAAVWAEENTREAIFDAFRRKEVYATSGPRIQLRFFGGWQFAPEDAEASDLAAIGYDKGVPMGGDLAQAPVGKAPLFLIHAVKDPLGANLDRIQVVKGWLDDKGVAHERIYNAALSDGRKENMFGRVKRVGNTVDLKTARYTNTIGDAQLAVVWTDPDFDPSQRAFYYVRVLQIPTPRNSLYDSVAMGTDPPKKYPRTIQERAYSSPIWYTP